MKLYDLLKIREQLCSALNIIDEEIMKHDWREIAHKNKMLATLAYFRTHNSTLEEARKKIEDYIGDTKD